MPRRCARQRHTEIDHAIPLRIQSRIEISDGPVDAELPTNDVLKTLPADAALAVEKPACGAGAGCTHEYVNCPGGQ